MKQQIIELKKKLLLVEIEQFDPVKIVDEKNISYFGQKLNKVGKLTDVKEKQFAELVKSLPNVWSHKYRDYKDYNCLNTRICYRLKTAKESFFSKLEADGIVFENKYGDCPPLLKASEEDEHGIASALRSERIGKWRKAQAKVWDINRCWIFEII